MIGSHVRLPENAPGKYYVTSACNGCGLCYSFAMQNFKYNSNATLYYVFRQPANRREEIEVLEAMSLCPKGCISSDGNAGKP